ncbi:E3 SUMO-protein ligase pli1 [Coemansia sp. RSA 921]|nr:E3 SUMO-protein ligase pli1 [Coemansia sp. RSA 921]
MAGKIRKTNLETIDKVRQQFFGKQSDDDDVIAEGALVNLKCPLGLCRIKVPCRSKQCQHSQCFDCATFLQFYNMTTGWKCPVCSVGIKSWNELIVDGYFEDILLKTSENDEQVFVEPNGDWKLKQDATIMGGTVGKISGRPLDVDEEEDPIDLSDSSDAGNQNSGRHKRRRTDFVDLTMDSDSDDAGEEDLQPMTQEEIEMINALEADAGSAIGSSAHANPAMPFPFAPMMAVSGAPPPGAHLPGYYGPFVTTTNDAVTVTSSLSAVSNGGSGSGSVFGDHDTNAITTYTETSGSAQQECNSYSSQQGSEQNISGASNCTDKQDKECN